MKINSELYNKEKEKNNQLIKQVNEINKKLETLEK